MVTMIQTLYLIKGKDPYPWLDDDDPRRNMTDQEILEKYIDLSDSDLNSAEKEKFVQSIDEVQRCILS